MISNYLINKGNYESLSTDDKSSAKDLVLLLITSRFAIEVHSGWIKRQARLDLPLHLVARAESGAAGNRRQARKVTMLPAGAAPSVCDVCEQRRLLLTPLRARQPRAKLAINQLRPKLSHPFRIDQLERLQDSALATFSTGFLLGKIS